MDTEERDRKFKRYSGYYKRFINGKKWFAAESKKFYDDVLDPMDMLWSQFNDEEKDMWFKQNDTGESDVRV